MVQRVVDRSRQLPVLQQVSGPQFEVLAVGRVEDLAVVQQINDLFVDGELGEIQLFLQRDLDNSDRSDVAASVAELEQQMVDADVKPWPGRTKVVELDWPNRQVRVLFLQNTPALLAIIPIIISAATIALALSVLVDLLVQLGVPVPGVIVDIADAVTLVALIATGILILRRFGLPLTLLIPGGLLVFALLSPETAFRVLKWTRETLGAALGLDPLLLGGAAALGIGGLFLVTRGGAAPITAGVAAIAAGSFLAFQGTRTVEGALDVPDAPPRPDQGALEVAGLPSFEVVQF